MVFTEKNSITDVIFMCIQVSKEQTICAYIPFDYLKYDTNFASHFKTIKDSVLYDRTVVDFKNLKKDSVTNLVIHDFESTNSGIRPVISMLSFVIASWIEILKNEFTGGNKDVSDPLYIKVWESEYTCPLLSQNKYIRKKFQNKIFKREINIIDSFLILKFIDNLSINGFRISDPNRLKLKYVKSGADQVRPGKTQKFLTYIFLFYGSFFCGFMMVPFFIFSVINKLSTSPKNNPVQIKCDTVTTDSTIATKEYFYKELKNNHPNIETCTDKTETIINIHN
ncbi:MAG: hypothetical protein EOP34_02975 [Rickettsiales bacterium]|nr:MAG: hypothetical protein EOP34_02975 [Rickettsiales bacterium]